MRVEYPENFDINNLKDLFLWRYLDVHKLIDLLHNEKIHFTRLDLFEDELEGITARNILLKAFTQSEAITEENINKTLPRDAQLRGIENDSKLRKEYSENLSNSQQTQFASCWFVGSKESVAMWKLYSKEGGVAVRFNAFDLAKSLIASAEAYTNSDFEVLVLGNVVYKNIWPLDMNEKFDGRFNAMKKDNSYSHENEFRFIAITHMRAKGKYEYWRLPIGALKSYDFQVVTSPYMNKFQKENIENLLSKYHLQEKIQQSKIAIRR